MSKVGLFGGSFNPIHVGHLALAEGAREALALDAVVFIPAGQPPHKDCRMLAPGPDRLRMVELAIADNPGFEVWDYEVHRPAVTYTIDTVRAWKAGHAPDDRVVFLIGADTICELASWKDVDLLLRECELVPVARPGWQAVVPPELARRVGDREAAALCSRMIRVPLVDVCSTDLRRRIAAGLSVRYLLPDSVAEYIRSRRLYAKAGFHTEASASCRNPASPA